MKKNVLGIGLKYFLVMPFILFLFVNYGSGQTASGTDESDTDKKIVDCEYGSEEIEVFGNDDCSKMFCAVWNRSVECTYDNGEKGKLGVLCSALKKPDGGWTCPGAYDCLMDEDHEYHEATKNNAPIFYSEDCEGAGILNRNTGVLQPFVIGGVSLTPLEDEDIPGVSPPDPVKNSHPEN